MFLSLDTGYSWKVLRVVNSFLDECEDREGEWWDSWPIRTATASWVDGRLTHILNENDVWLHDHEVDWLTPADCMFKRLTKAWRTALRKSDAVLHIDAEFTRPGMIALCEDW